ncbi:MAG: lactonase family protein [Segetibacter sp.]|nr:lactonase family protein [Segetibacter sp.]
MLRTCILIIVLFLFSGFQKTKKQVDYHLLIGTYTTGKSEGIYVYRFNTQTGKFSYESKAAISNPSFLAIAENAKNVFAIEESANNKGTINAYAFDDIKGTLTLIDTQSSRGDHPCYVSTVNNYVFAGNYTAGSLSAYQLNKDGSLIPPGQVIQHTGSGPDKARQEKPHVHAVVVAPDKQYLLATDLGIDKIKVYKIGNDKVNILTSYSEVSIDPGGGPRHLAFHPNKKWVYLVQEIKGQITQFSYNNGTLKQLQNFTMVAEGSTKKIGAADIHISADGKFLYASNRGDYNEIVIYAVNPTTGKLSLKGRQSTLGKTPRNFAIDPSGNFLLVANQNSDEIVIFKRNQQTGLLTPTGTKIEVGNPVCLQFVKAK